jgi:hypothetical protein
MSREKGEKVKKKSFISELRSDGKINENFLNVVSNLTLEELVAVKLELSTKLVKGKLYGLPLWYNLPYVVRDGLMEFVSRNCKTKVDMASTLGIPYDIFTVIYRNYIKNNNKE